MTLFELEIQSLITVRVEADDAEQARIAAMESSEFGDLLLQNAFISDAGEVRE